MHSIEDLITIFNRCFAEDYNTVLVKGKDEPVYIPSESQDKPNQVVFAHGFYRSAMHEIAHWCVAGEARRQLHDYGYWYEPDGRSLEQQVEFYKVEVKPQALEWILCVAARHPFKVSTDNLHLPASEIQQYEDQFKKDVAKQARQYLVDEIKGLPTRVKRLTQELMQHYQVVLLSKEHFSSDNL